MAKQDTFEASLVAFEQEGIRNLTNMKNKLVADEHRQSNGIIQRHNHVIQRWQKLLSEAASRKERLVQQQDQFRQIEELFLLFAKKASAFNSWFENAEEDLTDPVRCNSVEEIRALQEAHKQFQESLSSAHQDFEQVKTLKNYDKMGFHTFPLFTRNCSAFVELSAFVERFSFFADLKILTCI